jgi:hypothetical protein
MNILATPTTSTTTAPALLVIVEKTLTEGWIAIDFFLPL